MSGKLVSMAEAVSSIPDGSHVALGGFAITRQVIAFVHEMIRQQKKNLTVSQCIIGMETDLLVGMGCVSHLIYGGGSLDHFGLCEANNRAIARKAITIEEYSSLAICFKYLAGALGLPFMPIKSVMGSDMHKNLAREGGAKRVAEAQCPFTGENLLYVRALNPDVAVVHVNQSDEDGNAIILGPKWDNPEAAKASQRVILIAEEIVPSHQMQALADSVLIPAFRVDKVVHAPWGAYPSAVYHVYDYDAKHLAYYAEQDKDETKFRKYVDEYILGVKDYWEYLEKWGGLRRLQSLKADAYLGYSRRG
jgi:glutaconate CoA-transferase, subunit A